jgi:hypothetical protein
MKAIHGGTAKNDTIDSQKIALLLRGGMLPQAYVYPADMQATRALLRRHMHLRHKRSELLSHGQNPHRPYHLPELGKKIAYKAHREGVAARFRDPAVQQTIEVALARLETKHAQGKALTILAHKLARAVYGMLTRKMAFDMDLFLRA